MLIAANSNKKTFLQIYTTAFLRLQFFLGVNNALSSHQIVLLELFSRIRNLVLKPLVLLPEITLDLLSEFIVTILECV